MIPKGYVRVYKRDYYGKFVAIREKRVVASDFDEREVFRNIYKNFGRERPIYITKIPLEPIEEDIIPSCFEG